MPPNVCIMAEVYLRIRAERGDSATSKRRLKNKIKSMNPRAFISLDQTRSLTRRKQ